MESDGVAGYQPEMTRRRLELAAALGSERARSELGKESPPLIDPNTARLEYYAGFGGEALSHALRHAVDLVEETSFSSGFVADTIEDWLAGPPEDDDVPWSGEDVVKACLSAVREMLADLDPPPPGDDYRALATTAGRLLTLAKDGEPTDGAIADVYSALAGSTLVVPTDLWTRVAPRVLMWAREVFGPRSKKSLSPSQVDELRWKLSSLNARAAGAVAAAMAQWAAEGLTHDRFVQGDVLGQALQKYDGGSYTNWELYVGLPLGTEAKGPYTHDPSRFAEEAHQAFEQAALLDSPEADRLGRIYAAHKAHDALEAFRNWPRRYQLVALSYLVAWAGSARSLPEAMEAVKAAHARVEATPAVPARPPNESKPNSKGIPKLSRLKATARGIKRTPPVPTGPPSKSKPSSEGVPDLSRLKAKARGIKRKPFPRG